MAFRFPKTFTGQTALSCRKVCRWKLGQIPFAFSPKPVAILCYRERTSLANMKVDLGPVGWGTTAVSIKEGLAWLDPGPRLLCLRLVVGCSYFINFFGLDLALLTTSLLPALWRWGSPDPTTELCQLPVPHTFPLLRIHNPVIVGHSNPPSIACLVTFWRASFDVRIALTHFLCALNSKKEARDQKERVSHFCV